MDVYNETTVVPDGTAATEFDPAIAERAALLTNPVSGIASDFLNHFNEIFLLIENLPVLLPEMVEELMQWQPITYVAYFERSNLPGSRQALIRYGLIDADFRRAFEAAIERLNAMALRIIDGIGQHRDRAGHLNADDVTDFCAAAAIELREALDRAASMINSGKVDEQDAPQSLADHLLSR